MDGGQEMHLPCVQRPAERARFRHGEQWDRAAHRGDTVERKPLARHFARLLPALLRSEEHTSELQSLMRISYAVFCLKKKQKHNPDTHTNIHPSTIPPHHHT